MKTYDKLVHVQEDLLRHIRKLQVRGKGRKEGGREGGKEKERREREIEQLREIERHT